MGIGRVARGLSGASSIERTEADRDDGSGASVCAAAVIGPR
jgi:hypothetical protein